MTSPQQSNQPDELQKAIERLNDWNRNRDIYTHIPTEMCVDEVLLAAKQLQQVEKERDEILVDLHNTARGNSDLIQNRDSLKAALEKCVNALDAMSHSFDCNLHPTKNVGSPFCNCPKNALTDPTVQAVLNQNPTQCHPLNKPNDT